MKVNFLVLLVFLAVTLAVDSKESKDPQRGVIHQIRKGVAGPNPYIFLTIPKGRSQTLIQGFEVVEDSNDNKTSASKEDNEEEEDDDDENETEDDDDDDDDNSNVELDHYSDDDNENDEKESKNYIKRYDKKDYDEDDEMDNIMNVNLKLRKTNVQIKNAKPTKMMISREHAGAILVPDEIIEIEVQSVIDQKSGKPALLLPRAILDSIPDGSVVAFMERSLGDKEVEERANRVIVRRRRKGARRNIKRRIVNTRGGNKQHRQSNKPKSVRIIRDSSRQHDNKRRRVSLQEEYRLYK